MRGRRLVVLAGVVALAVGCAGGSPSGPATEADPGGVVLPSPTSTTADPHARLQAAIDAFVTAAADFPSDGAITPEQAAVVEETYEVAKDLSAEAAETSDATLIVVFPVYATMPGLPFGTLWTSTHPAETGIDLTTTWDEQVALLNGWVLSQPAGAYETLVQPPSRTS